MSQQLAQQFALPSLVATTTPAASQHVAQLAAVPRSQLASVFTEEKGVQSKQLPPQQGRAAGSKD